MKNSNLTKEEILTLNTYKEIAGEWAKEHADLNLTEYFDQFEKYLPEGKILEVGAGAGRDAKEFLRRGYDYTGTDISDDLLQIARKLNPKTKFITQSVYDLDFPKDYFDGFWSYATLLHLPKSKIAQALTKIHSVLKKDGLGHISLKQGGSEKIVKEQTPSGKDYQRFFAYYTNEEFSKILVENGFKILKSEIKPVTKKTTWLIYFVKKI